MRQVPATYLIIGNGRLASHLSHYFNLLHIPYKKWQRGQNLEDLKIAHASTQQTLLAITDSAISSFIEAHQLSPSKCIHFSGALSTPLATRLHPLMTFAPSLYDLETYKKIPFVGEYGSKTLADLLPELSNPSFSLPQNNGDLYHALCVLAGNGTTVLWQNVTKQFVEQLGLPAAALHPYMEQICKNLLTNSDSALTGPWARNDLATIQKNQEALKNTPYLNLYLSLMNTYVATSPTVAMSERSYI